MGINKIEQMQEHTKGLNILVVEDSQVFQTFYKQLIGSYFKNYYTAMDGCEGLKLYEENPNKYDIIIADHQMPNMDGLEMITHIKEINPDVHVIFITGTSEIEVLTEVTHMSIDAIISKPVNKIQLLSKIVDIAAKIIDKRDMQLYLEQLEQMNQAICQFKDKLRKKIKLLCDIPEAQGISAELEALINKPISLMRADEDGGSEMLIHKSEDIDEDFDVEKAMREYGKEDVENTLIEKDTPELSIEVENADSDKEHEGRFKDVRYTVVDKISAEEFVSEIDEGTFSELDDFREDLDNFNMLLNDLNQCESSHFHGYLDQVAAFYHRLFQTVNSFVVFSTIENTFKEFASFIENIQKEQLEDIEKQEILVDALFALADDLTKWITIIFYDRNTDNIHYFDASFANTCLEIEAMFNEEEVEVAEDDEELLEFF